MAWQRNGMGAAWERHGMCELALRVISGSHRGVNGVFRSSGILCSVDRWVATDVSGRRVGPTSNSQEVKKWVVADVSEQSDTDSLPRNID
jgi:hypothetical protein